MFSRIFSSSHCRVITKSHAVIQVFPQTRSLHIAHRIRNINSKINYLNCYSRHLVDINTNSIRFSSTTGVTKEFVQDALPQIPDAPTPVVPEITDIVGEASLASFGLGSYTPVGMIQHYLYWLHTTCGLPWWATIIIATTSVRVLLFPIFLKQQKHQTLTQFYHKDIAYFEKKKKEAVSDRSQEKLNLFSAKQDAFYAAHNMMTFKNIAINHSLQGFVFITYFMALRNMASTPIDSMREGGLLWFLDLTRPDPYYILPLVSAACTSLFIYLTPLPITGGKLLGFQKYFKFIIPLVALPFMIYFNTATLAYIITTTWLAFFSAAILRIPKCRAFFRVPPIVKLDPTISNNPETTALTQSLKDIWKDMRQSRAENAAYSLDQRKFQSAGKGPLVKTYKFDPTKVIK